MKVFDIQSPKEATLYPSVAISVCKIHYMDFWYAYYERKKFSSKFVSKSL